MLLGAYAFGVYAYEFTALPPAERLQKAVEYGAQIHPQYEAEYENGISVGWHRVPWVLGCYGFWTDDARKRHYKNLCAIDGRIALAGEHASLSAGLAGRRDPLGARRDHATARAHPWPESAPMMTDATGVRWRSA